jgi:hypothetical protein
MKEPIDVIEIANKLTNEDMVRLIHVFSDRIYICRKTGENEYTTDGLDRVVPCHLNGATIQLNTDGVYEEEFDTVVFNEDGGGTNH